MVIQPKTANFRSPKGCFDAFIATKLAGNDEDVLQCYTPAKATREIGVVIMEIAANVFMETELKSDTLELLTNHGVSESLLRDVIENGPAKHGNVLSALDSLGKQVASPEEFMSDVRARFPRPKATDCEWKSVEINGNRATALRQKKGSGYILMFDLTFFRLCRWPENLE